MALAAAGVVAGVVVALVLTRLLRGLLHGVTPADPATFAAVAGALIAVALARQPGARVARDARRSRRRAKIRVIERAPVHAALLRDVRLHVHGLSFRVPAAADRAVPHPGARRQHAGVRAVSRLPDLFVGVLGAGHRRARRPARHSPHPDRLQPHARRASRSVVRGHSRLPRDARAGPRARRVLVGLALGVGGLPDQHAARAPARRRGRLLGAVVDRRGRRRAVGRLLGVPIRLARALPRCRGPQPRHGRDRLAAAAAVDHVDLRASMPTAAILEWRVLLLSLTLFLYSFGYGGITSFTALYADAIGIRPKGHVPDGAGGRDPGDAAAVRTPGRSLRLPARLPAVPGR